MQRKVTQRKGQKGNNWDGDKEIRRVGMGLRQRNNAYNFGFSKKDIGLFSVVTSSTAPHKAMHF